MSANPIRGEVTAMIGSLELIMAITMDGLARVSAASGYPTLGDLYSRFHGTEPATVMLAIDHFTVKGKVDGKELGKEEAISQARLRITMDDLLAMQGPLQGLLAALLRKTEGESPPGKRGERPEPLDAVLRRWLEDGQGRLGLSPTEFWNATLAEYMALVRGWNRAQSNGVEPMSRERLDQLIREHGATSKSIKKQQKPKS